VNRIKRKRTLIGLCSFAILLFLVIGYAAYTEQLKLKANYNINENFSVKITNIESTTLGGHAINAEAPTYTDTTATFNTKLYLPGDYAEYIVTVVNDGNIDAYLKSIDPDPENAVENESAIKFSLSGIKTGQSLKSESTVQFKVRIDYDINVTEQPTELNASYDLTLFYEQGEGTVDPGEIIVPPTENKTADILRAKANGDDGLYEDSYESGRYIYKGSNPKNNIKFNNENWKIVSVEKNDTIKIIRSSNVGNKPWNESGSKVWSAPASLNTYLNNTYYSSLSNEAQNQITAGTFNIGSVNPQNVVLSDAISKEKLTTSNNKIALASISEYMNASSAGNCDEPILTCSASLASQNWMANILGQCWLINPFAATNEIINIVAPNGNVYYISANIEQGVVPVLYLNSNISITGTGSATDPYIIA